MSGLAGWIGFASEFYDLICCFGCGYIELKRMLIACADVG